MTTFAWEGAAALMLAVGERLGLSFSEEVLSHPTCETTPSGLECMAACEQCRWKLPCPFVVKNGNKTHVQTQLRAVQEWWMIQAQNFESWPYSRMQVVTTAISSKSLWLRHSFILICSSLSLAVGTVAIIKLKEDEGPSHDISSTSLSECRGLLPMLAVMTVEYFL